ncbi:glycosyl hydrolase family 62 protein [Lojkania enalia]|uniref:Alpha-L-arabinofuranosidase n=1 Tax=Lojkania enalia TaxID=147567 RepID=A0A9P4K0K9_9PLEO|nr:glycosyl hydrolase family 62 protein [Didymosphaeria enalia]
MLLVRLLIIAVVVVAAPVSSPRDTFKGPSDTIARQVAGLPSSFKWESTGILVGPPNDSRKLAALKDPSIVYYEGKYHVFVSTVDSGGYNLAYLSFTDFDEAKDAPLYYLDQSAIGTGYRAAPQVFYFEPQKLWYLVFQNGNAGYSTNKNISDPTGWSSIKNFYSSMPSIISEHIGDGYWLDMWVICDAEECHLFSSDDMGQLYRSSTSIADFPNGMSNTVIALSEPNRFDLFEASNVYYISSGTYLLLVECIGSDDARYFRSWTSNAITGPWKSLADSEANPFARSNNVVFSGEVWTESISHGEVVRTNVDQTMTISPCKLRFMYQGLDPAASGDYNSLPWKLGLLTQTNSAC